MERAKTAELGPEDQPVRADLPEQVGPPVWADRPEAVASAEAVASQRFRRGFGRAEGSRAVVVPEGPGGRGASASP